MPTLTRGPDVLIGAAVAALALALRLPRLGNTPGWDGDEGYNLEIAWQLLHGRTQFFALEYAFVQHPPLFYVLLAPLLGLLGPTVLAPRLLAAAASALAAGLLYAAVAPVSGRRPALLAALSLAGTHFAVLYGRFGYTYDLLLLWSAATLWCVLAWRRNGRQRWLGLAAGAAALGLLTDQEGLFLPLFVSAAAWPRRRLAAGTLALGVTPAATFGLAILVLSPGAAGTDWGSSLLRVGGAGIGGPSGMAALVARWFVNYLHLLRAEWWLPLGVAGLFCIQPLHARRTALLLGGVMALPIFALRELEPFFRTGIPLLVPLCWGAGALLDAGLTALFTTFRAPPTGSQRGGRALAGRLGPAALAALVVALPLGLEIGRSAGAAAAGFQTRFDWALVSGGEQDASRAAASFVGAERRADEVVICSPHVAWLYPAPVTDLFQSVASTGRGVAFYPPAIPAARFRFDPSAASARYAVVDPFWDRWATSSPAVAALLVEVERWSPAWRTGSIRVYRRPE